MNATIEKLRFLFIIQYHHFFPNEKRHYRARMKTNGPDRSCNRALKLASWSQCGTTWDKLHWQSLNLQISRRIFKFLGKTHLPSTSKSCSVVPMKRLKRHFQTWSDICVSSCLMQCEHYSKRVIVFETHVHQCGDELNSIVNFQWKQNSGLYYLIIVSSRTLIKGFSGY